VLDLSSRGYTPVVVDNYITGSRRIAEVLETTVCEGTLEDRKFLKNVFSKYNPEAVMHFAAHAYVGESVKDPLKYYRNNVAATITLLEVMKECDVTKMIFSSTCATYGIPEKLPITEQTPQRPINPYGTGKLTVEKILLDCDTAWGLKSVIFRYFNAAGASASGKIGEMHDPETHLIPLVIAAALHGKTLSIFGNDYPTADGTCVRDYIHVEDISAAHIKGFEYLKNGGKTEVFNIGTEKGNSIKEVIDCVEKLSGKKVPHKFEARREGDPPTLVASAAKLRKVLSWSPKYNEIAEIIGTALNWHSK
jgi:UDP-glucose 4-epimerase